MYIRVLHSPPINSVLTSTWSFSWARIRSRFDRIIVLTQKINYNILYFIECRLIERVVLVSFWYEYNKKHYWVSFLNRCEAGYSFIQQLYRFKSIYCNSQSHGRKLLFISQLLFQTYIFINSKYTFFYFRSQILIVWLSV